MMYHLLKNICKVISLVIFRVKITGADKFNNTEGRLIICSNHVSMIDPILLAAYTKRRISFMGKKELFDNPLLKVILSSCSVFPVDRQAGGLNAMRHAISLLKEDKILGIFPEGTRVKKLDLESAKSGISFIASMGKSRVIPVFIKSDFKFLSRLEIIFGEPKDYFEGIEGKITNDMHNEISKQILLDIYALENEVAHRGKE